MVQPADVRLWWSRHHSTALRVAIAVLAVFMLVKLGSEFFRLVFDQSGFGAVDLRMRYREVHHWFAGLPVYPVMKNSTYPPMSYAVLWLALGWAPVSVCRWLWAVASVLSLCWLSWMTVQESGASTRLERSFAALLPLSLNATGVAIGNGQLVPLLAPMLWAAILLLARKQDTGWRSELAIVTLMLASLVHPATASPFFLIVLIVPSRIRPAALVVLGYIALTLLAASFQTDDLTALLRGWLHNAAVVTPSSGYADLHYALYLLGLRDWALPASGIVIAVLGVWIFVHRRLDPCLLLGVTAIVARLWTYHGLYDDLLIIFPMVTLFRIAKGAAQDDDDVRAAVLLGSAVIIMLMPARMHHFWAEPGPALFALTHTFIWLAILVFLVRRARKEFGAVSLSTKGRKYIGSEVCRNNDVGLRG